MATRWSIHGWYWKTTFNNITYCPLHTVQQWFTMSNGQYFSVSFNEKLVPRACAVLTPTCAQQAAQAACSESSRNFLQWGPGRAWGFVVQEFLKELHGWELGGIQDTLRMFVKASLAAWKAQSLPQATCGERWPSARVHYEFPKCISLRWNGGPSLEHFREHNLLWHHFAGLVLKDLYYVWCLIRGNI